MHDETHLPMHALPVAFFRFSVVLAAVAASLCVAGPAAGQTQPPEAPHIWSVDSLSESVRIHWHLMMGADSYDVRWKSQGQSYHDSRMVEGIEASPYLLGRLTNGTRYTVQVRATNSAGNSGWSNERERTPTVPPDAPVLRATPGDRSITVTWDDVAGAYYYQLAWTRTGNNESGLDNGVWSTSHTIENLEPGKYRLTAWTRNAEGNTSERSEYVYAKVRKHIGPGTVTLCGTRIGTPTRLSFDAELDICWNAGGTIPTGKNVVIEARERYFWDDTEPFRAWERVARGNSFTACSGGDDACLQHTRVGSRGLAFEMELRIRRGPDVLATSPVLRAHVPNSDANELRSSLRGAVDEDTGRGIDVAEGPFGMQLEFTDPYMYLALTEVVLGLETADFDVTNARVTGVETRGNSGTYRVRVTPTILGEPVTIHLPANKVKGVGEGVSSSGGNNYTRDNTASNTFVQETAAPASRAARSEGAPLTAAMNRAPRPVGTIPPQVLSMDDAELTLDTAGYFADEDEDGMTFAARSADPAVAAVAMAGPLLTATAVGPGTATVTVTASDAAGLKAEQAFELRVADRWGRAATRDTLAALGRGYLSSVRETLGRRVESRVPEAEMRVAGQRIPLDRSAAREVGASLVRRLFPQAGSPGGPRLAGQVSPGQAGFGRPGLGSPVPGASAFGMPGSGRAMPGSSRGLPAAFPSTMGPGHLAVGSPAEFGGSGRFGGGASQALRSTNVVLPLGRVSSGQASAGTAPPSPGRRWTVWGQGDVQAFRGGPADDADGSSAAYDGDLRTVYAGVDARLNERWMTGVALARSAGPRGGTQAGRAGGWRRR